MMATPGNSGVKRKLSATDLEDSSRGREVEHVLPVVDLEEGFPLRQYLLNMSREKLEKLDAMRHGKKKREYRHCQFVLISNAIRYIESQMAADSENEASSDTETVNGTSPGSVPQSLQNNLPNRSPCIYPLTPPNSPYPQCIASSSHEDSEIRDSVGYRPAETLNGIQSLHLSPEVQGNLPDIRVFVRPMTASCPIPEPVASSSQEGGEYSSPLGLDSHSTTLWSSGQGSLASSFLESHMDTNLTQLLPCNQLGTVDSRFLESQVDADMTELLPCNHLTATQNDAMQCDTHKVELSPCSQLTRSQNSSLLHSQGDTHLTELWPFTPPAHTLENAVFQDSSFTQAGETSSMYSYTIAQSHTAFPSPTFCSAQTDSVTTPASQPSDVQFDTPVLDSPPASAHDTNPFLNCHVEEGNLNSAEAQESDDDSSIDEEISSFIHDPENVALLIEKLEEATSSTDTEQNSPQPSASQGSFHSNSCSTFCCAESPRDFDNSQKLVIGN